MPILEPMTVAEMAEWGGGHQSQLDHTAEDVGKWLSKEMWSTTWKDSATLASPVFGCLTSTHRFHTYRSHSFPKGTSCEILLLLNLDPSPVFHISVQIMSSDSSWFSDLWVNSKFSHILYIIGERKENCNKNSKLQKGECRTSSGYQSSHILQPFGTEMADSSILQ